MEATGLKRVQVLNVPVDGLDEESALKAVEQYLMDGRRHQIVFLDRRALLRGRRRGEFRRCLREASLVLPTAPEIVTAARFLKRGVLHRFSSFPFVIRMLNAAERLNRTVYLIGSRKEELEKAERNLRASFRNLRLVGRFAGFYSKEMEKNIILAIKKAAPSILLAGNGLPDRELWVLRHQKDFQPGIYLWVGECFDLFSGRKKRSAGPESMETLKRPWKLLSLLYFWILAIVYKLFRL